ncbi:MAG: penicillin acylase family protein [Polyangiaceae bacterium]|nr:penicillin acylase family protein [Polyangiaceae bacterium]
MVVRDYARMLPSGKGRRGWVLYFPTAPVHHAFMRRSLQFLRQSLSTAVLAALPLTVGCSSEPTPVAPNPDQTAILSVGEAESWMIPGLQDEVHVVRTESNVPHIYAKNRVDLARVQGFVMARDRYFMMDLERRLATGRLSELLGDSALATDQEWRAQGAAYVTDRILEGLGPELSAQADAFAEGINEYIVRVKNDELPPPSELKLASALLGVLNPNDLMTPFDRRDVAAMVAVIIYQTSYEGGDVGRAATAAKLPTLFDGVEFQELRRQGAIKDLWEQLSPIMPRSSAPGFGLEEGNAKPTGSNKKPQGGSSAGGPVKQTPAFLLERLSQRLERMQNRLLRQKDAGYGSNAWAVAGSKTTTGAAMLAGDGHLSLSVPSILYQVGLDTSVFGGGNTHQLGLVIAGFPVMPIGTNGKVAWSQTQLGGDVTDWYREEIQLGADGLPAKSMFQGAWKDLVKKDESYVIANVDALGSVGRTENWPRFETFDGRWIADIEGNAAKPGDPVGAGQTIVNLGGKYVIPSDVDGDGVVTAISFDYAGFDVIGVLPTTDRLGHAADVHEFREATKGLVAYSQNFAVADSSGNIFYTSYQTVPCRGYLPRNPDGTFQADANPDQLLDGTVYGAFRIPTLPDGKVDEAPGKNDPYACVIPFDDMPASLNPNSGYVATANNDPGNISTDNSLTNDKWYIGGTWDVGFRADTISRELEKAIADGTADEDAMARIQANTQSRTGELLAETFVESIKKGRALSAKGGLLSPSEQRIVDLYDANKADFDAAEMRLGAWKTAGYEARSGVETFYSTPTATDKESAVATSIWNAWLSRALQQTFNDDQLPGVFNSFSSGGQIRAMWKFLNGRGANNPEKLASWNVATSESIFFDVLGTPEVETSDEVLLKALADAFAFLKSAPNPDTPAEGGYGTTDMSKWLWGLRHYVRFQSLLDDFLDDPQYASFTQPFAITTKILPLKQGTYPADDPRKDLLWFPRNGDQFSVDAANPGFNGQRFSYGSGPVMRMVVSLKGEEVTGRNIIPGGQSAVIESEFFADQTKLWLANDTLPMRFSPKDVAAGATLREVYKPKK